MGQGIEQEADVFLVRRAADEQGDRCVGRNVEATAKVGAGGTALGPEVIDGNAGRHAMQRRGDAIVDQRVLHRAGRHDDRIERVALAPRERTRKGPQRALGQGRDVVVQVFLEMRVIGGDAGQAQAACMAQAGIVRGEGRLHMDQIAGQRTEIAQRAAQRLAMHQTILGVEGNPPCRHARDAGIVKMRRRIRRRNDSYLDVLFRQGVAKGLDGGGDAIDAGEIYVGDHQDAHGNASSRTRVTAIFQPAAAVIFPSRPRQNPVTPGS